MALPRGVRLRTPAQFQAAGRGAAVRRYTRGWLALTAKSVDGAAAPRFGFTVAKRLARRAVDRASVKRVLREAARAALPALRDLPAQHIVLRLNAAIPDTTQLPRARLKRAVRRDADALLALLSSRPAAGH